MLQLWWRCGGGEQASRSESFQQKESFLKEKKAQLGLVAATPQRKRLSGGGLLPGTAAMPALCFVFPRDMLLPGSKGSEGGERPRA